MAPTNSASLGGGVRQFENTPRHGLTLIELVVVLLILIALAGMVIPNVAGTASDARYRTTEASLRRLQDIIMNRYWPDMDAVMIDGDGNPIEGFPHPSASDITQESRQKHPQLVYLFIQPRDAPDYEPRSRRGWNGPYLQDSGTKLLVTGSYGNAQDPAPIDSWQNPIIIQTPSTPDPNDDESLYTRLISAGPNGIINSPSNDLELLGTQRGDDIVLFLRIPDPRPSP